MSKLLFNTVLVGVGCIVLFLIAQNLINERKVPSLGDFLASSTELAASSTSHLLDDVRTMSSSTDTMPTSLIGLATTTITTTQGTLKVYIADTDVARQHGLSDVPSLPNDTGMLFVFNYPGSYGFWMKDMNFPLDIVWIDSNKIVTGVSKDLSPSSYPSSFTPAQPILYVLEINAHTSEIFGLTPGSQIHFSLP